MLSAKVQEVTSDGVTLADGRAFHARCVVDARGQKPGNGLTVAYQKFVGLEVRLRKPHGQQYPVIMDATVPQRDGYRFVYTLPFSADRMLIEDTYYSDSPLIDLPRLREGCLSYGKTQGWRIAEVVREEQGVLPVVLSGDIEAMLTKNPADVALLGVRAGFFHHTTSYSFPFAVRCAEAIARIDPLASETLAPLTRAWQRQHWRDQRFFRLLNRMLFWAAKPDRRYRVLERFYEMREPLIERFYSSRLTLADQARILAGWPPVPLGKALRVLGETRKNPLTPKASSLS
jgi:lycopene beta-cyclase